MLNLEGLKPLTTLQYDESRAKALARVNARIGERPKRAQFRRELGAIATPLDWLALVVFAAALAISSAHIVVFMTGQAVGSYHALPNAPGVVLERDTWAVIHQVGMILLAEAAALLFMTSHTMSRQARAQRPAWARWYSVSLVLALLAAAFVLMANLSSGVNVLVSLMPPAFTLGIAVRLEVLIADYLRRHDDISTRYLAAMAVYEAASADATKHPEYLPMLRQELWAAIARKNSAYIDAPAGVRHAAVRRELERDTWAYEAAPDAAPVIAVNGNGNGVRHAPENPLALPVLTTGGNGKRP